MAAPARLMPEVSERRRRLFDQVTITTKHPGDPDRSEATSTSGWPRK